MVGRLWHAVSLEHRPVIRGGSTSWMKTGGWVPLHVSDAGEAVVTMLSWQGFGHGRAQVGEMRALF